MSESPVNSNNTLRTSDIGTLDYLHGVKSSTCLLLPTTPSPTPVDIKHPLSEEIGEEQFLNISDGPNLQNLDVSAGDSSSSADSNSVVQDPVSAQLINNISMLDYQTLSKTGDFIMGEVEDCKLNGNMNLNNRKLPSFVNWNWALIRKILLWIVMSGLVACIAAIVAMVVTLPKVCNPDLPWYQGKVFYEIFPASFKDSNNDGIGDLKGLLKELDYIQDLGVSAIRLNSIFQTDHYPNNYNNISSLKDIDRSIGVLKDFQDLIVEVHNRSMFLILDVPVLSVVSLSTISSSNSSNSAEDNIFAYTDPTTVAIKYWAHSQNVDGFYLKKLERFVNDVDFAKSLQIWKQIIGYDKILIVNEDVYQNAKGDSLNVLLSRVDLIDINLDIHSDIKDLKDRIDNIIAGTLWGKPYYPWVHWNIGNIDSERLSTKQANNALTLTTLEFMLPGTVSIFYGDEIGLSGLVKNEVEGDFHEYKDVHNLVSMIFPNNSKDSKNIGIFSWNSGSVSEPRYDFLEVIKDLIKVRLNTPTVYLRAIYKEGNIQKNMAIRKTEEQYLFIIERWYPRRNTCVFVGNLGNTSITTDLSSMFYGGKVVAGTNTSLVDQVLYFDQVTFPPYSAIILKLEK